MSRFKRCEIGDCLGVVSRTAPITIRLHSTDEGFGQQHTYARGHGKRCAHCGNIRQSKRIGNIKIRICNQCYKELRDECVKSINIYGLSRNIESFDDKKKILYYSLKRDDSPSIIV